MKLYLILLFCMASLAALATGPYGPVTMHHHHVNHFRADSLKPKKDSVDTMKVVHRKFTIDASWASNNTFMGRRDTVNHQLISPTFAYEGIHGFNASFALSHSTDLVPIKNAKGKTRKQPVFDQYDIALGWDHDWSKRFSTSLTNTHSWFDAKSARLRSVIDNDLNFGGTWDQDFIKADLTGDWCHGPKSKFGELKDFFYTFSVSHDFDFDDIFGSSWEFEVEPKFSAVYGTQNFYKVYTKGIPLDSTVIKKLDYQKQLSKYNMLNYLFAVPITFTHHKWAFSFEYDYNMPQNLVPGSSSVPYSVFMADIKLTMKGKAIKIKKRKWERKK
ncbi:MAG: hypothetical protein ACHQRM_15080 [Bacteroidia bacterium]